MSPIGQDAPQGAIAGWADQPRRGSAPNQAGVPQTIPENPGAFFSGLQNQKMSPILAQLARQLSQSRPTFHASHSPLSQAEKLNRPGIEAPQKLGGLQRAFMEKYETYVQAQGRAAAPSPPERAQQTELNKRKVEILTMKSFKRTCSKFWRIHPPYSMTSNPCRPEPLKLLLSHIQSHGSALHQYPSHAIDLVTQSARHHGDVLRMQGHMTFLNSGGRQRFHR